MSYPLSPEQHKQAEHIVFLFELAHKRALQLMAEGNHPDDLYTNASAVLYAYECLLDADLASH